MTNLTLEGLARTLCKAKGIDPDGIGYSETPETIAALGESYPLWRYQAEFSVKPILACIQDAHRIAPIEASLDMLEAGRVGAEGSEWLSDIYRAMINASPIIGEKG